MSIPDLYAEQDALTDPGAFAVLFEDLPATPSELRHVVSELIMHVAWTERYGAAPAGPIDRDTQPVAIRLAAIQIGIM